MVGTLGLEQTRTPDLYRVNFEVADLKPFLHRKQQLLLQALTLIENWPIVRCR